MRLPEGENLHRTPKGPRKILYSSLFLLFLALCPFFLFRKYFYIFGWALFSFLCLCACVLCFFLLALSRFSSFFLHSFSCCVFFLFSFVWCVCMRVYNKITLSFFFFFSF